MILFLFVMPLPIWKTKTSLYIAVGLGLRLEDNLLLLLLAFENTRKALDLNKPRPAYTRQPCSNGSGVQVEVGSKGHGGRHNHNTEPGYT